MSLCYLLFVVICVSFLHLAYSAVPDDIPGLYAISKVDRNTARACPAFIQHNSYVKNSTGFIQIFHNSIEVNDGTKCNGRQLFPFTVLLESEVFEREVKNNPNIFNATSATKDGELFQKLLIRSRSIFGLEPFADRVCGAFTFREGTLVAFVRNTTESVPQLGLTGLEKGLTYLIMIETNVNDPKRCVYVKPVNATNRDNNNSTRACFPAAATITLHDGSTVRADSVKHGANVRLARSQSSPMSRTSRVFAFSHRDASVVANFVRLSTEHGAKLTLSPDHYVFSDGRMKLASLIRVGDRLDMEATTTRVTKVEHNVQATGLYNPHTIAGELIVEGFRVSCYTKAVHPSLAHAMLAPIRILWDMTGGTQTLPSPLAWLHTNTPLRLLSRLLPAGPSEMRWDTPTA